MNKSNTETVDNERQRLVAMRLKKLFNDNKDKLGLTQEKLALSMGVTQGTVWQYLNGRIPVNIGFLRKFLTGMGMTVDDVDADLLQLMFPDGGDDVGLLRRLSAPALEEESSGVADKKPAPYLSSEYVHVRRTNLSAGLGEQEQDIASEQVVDYLAFKKTWVARRGLNPLELALISCRGDSMEPTLIDGDLVLVDLRQKDIDEDGIYAIAVNGQIRVKRLHQHVDGTVEVASDSAKYPAEKYNEEQAEALIRVIGHVVWIGREL